MSYGEGAVMGVPSHDERDFAFALKYGLPITQVIAKEGHEYDNTVWHDWYADKEGTYCINSGKYNGLNFEEARKISRRSDSADLKFSTVCATGASPVSVTGALRSRSLTVRTAAPFRFRKKISRLFCRTI